MPDPIQPPLNPLPSPSCRRPDAAPQIPQPVHFYDRHDVRDMCADCLRWYEPRRRNTLIPAVSPDLKPEHKVQCFSRIAITTAPIVAHI